MANGILIKDLDTFSGTPGSGDYLAIDNGTETTKISAQNLLKQVVDALANYVTSADLTQTLTDYVTNSGLLTVLAGYTTDAELQTALAAYVTSIDLAADLADYAKTDGYYENLGAGTADNLATDIKSNDKTPYLFRTAGGSVDIGDREKLNAIVGGSVAWNQLIQNGNFADTNNWNRASNVTISVSGNVATITSTANWGRIDQTVNAIKGHKYFVGGFIKLSEEGKNARILWGNSSTGNPIYQKSATTTAWADVSGIANANQDDTTMLILSTAGTPTSFDAKNVNITDLTALFGSTIADYVYTLESGTAGAGIAWLRKHAPYLFTYHAYNAGSIESVSGLVSHDTTGFNQWDEQWQIGAFNSSGVFVTGYNFVCSKNPIKVLPNTTYSCTKNILRWEYDADMNLLVSAYASTGGNTFTTTANTAFINFRTNYEATAYANDICINLSWDGSRDGEYEAYVKHSYALDSDLTLRGIPKLDSSNNLYYDGDEYASDGTVTRKYGVVDLGTLTWVYNSSNTWFYTESLKNDIVKGKASVISNIVTPKYLAVTRTDAPNLDKCICVDSAGFIIVKDSAYTDAPTFKTAMSGVYLVYELATPTTETADPYQQVQLCDDFGTEEWALASGTFPMPVGHDTDYPVNLKSKLEMAPNSPDGDGVYVVKQTSGTNEYVPLVIPSGIPSVPSTDGTYTLKATVSGGTTTLNWEA